MDGSWQQLLLPPPVSGVTINTVWISPAARTVLYGAMAAAFAAGFFAFFTKRYPAAAAVRRGVLAALFAAGILYSLRADFGWSLWVRQDLRTFGGLTTEEKLLKLDGALYDFVRRARTVLPGDYMLFSPDQYLLWRTEYLLLPLRKRTTAPTVIVLADPQASYDPRTGIFTRGDLRREGMAPLLQFGPDAFIVTRQ
jgi:hypothetical protein